MARTLELAASAGPRRIPATGPRMALAERYCQVRFATEALCDPLSPEDLSVRSLREASPVKWHLGHVSWFLERFLLAEVWRDYAPFNRAFDALFAQEPASQPNQEAHGRALASRPTLDEVLDYRRHVDSYVLALLCADEGVDPDVEERVALGLHHEQQHQERILTDVKHALSQGPLRPAYLERPFKKELLSGQTAAQPLAWERFATTLAQIGHAGAGFANDNEQPRHQVLVHGFELASRPVSCGEYLEFIADGGYTRPELWLADGWAEVVRQGMCAPLYWQRDAGEWLVFTLGGVREVSPAEPVCHVSYYEADAYARWRKARLPTEQEWEVAAQALEVNGNFADSGILHPLPLAENEDAPGRPGPRQMFGDVWQWTASPYVAYPGFAPRTGGPGRSDAAFMVNQMVLRGGSCATPRALVRPTLRNFLPPQARWQFTGIRLAR